jgi:hypothetical protein
MDFPSVDCMHRLFDQLGNSSTGNLDVVLRCFKRNVKQDGVSFSNQQWQVGKYSRPFLMHNVDIIICNN